jgi:hypothetical protein
MKAFALIACQLLVPSLLLSLLTLIPRAVAADAVAPKYWMEDLAMKTAARGYGVAGIRALRDALVVSQNGRARRMMAIAGMSYLSLCWIDEDKDSILLVESSSYDRESDSVVIKRSIHGVSGAVKLQLAKLWFPVPSAVKSEPLTSENFGFVINEVCTGNQLNYEVRAVGVGSTAGSNFRTTFDAIETLLKRPK